MNRPAAALLAALAVAVGLVACASSDAGGDTVVTSVRTVVAESNSVPTTAVPAATVPEEPTTTDVAGSTEVVPPVTEGPATTDNALIVSDAEVADLEKQLDEIDQLLAGIDADLSHD